MSSFKFAQQSHQESWRKTNLPSIKGNGRQNGGEYFHVLPFEQHKHNFYPQIQKDLLDPVTGYLVKNNIKPHTGIHNLLSSWVVCANMYWPFNNLEGFALLAKFLSIQTCYDIASITCLELEYEEEGILKPAALLGEDAKGMRGSGQTSPDLAVKFITSKNKRGILLIESKFTEHSFYSCSGYKKQNQSGRTPSPDNSHCKNPSLILKSNFQECHLISWGRKYWEILKADLSPSAFLAAKACPMSTCCYQLFRQQALAKGYQNSGKYDIVASCVATDARNTSLINSGKRTGLNPFPQGWKDLFPSLPFFWFTHQDWYEFVKTNNRFGVWDYWIEYVSNRYKL